MTRGTTSLFLRDGAWQSLPPTVDAGAEVPPFSRQPRDAARPHDLLIGRGTAATPAAMLETP